jgi:proteasome accessory factor A
METEYAVMARGPGFGEDDRALTASWLLSAARRELRALPDEVLSGLYLENGSRLYIDSGNHPELSTPECASPRDAVRYALAGDRIVASLQTAVTRARRGVEMTITRSNVDHSGAMTTWGCHESYLCRTRPARLPRWIIPHLVSRIIYTGAGGFNNLAREAEFVLSPRVPHLERVVSEESTEARGIFHTKNQPLCDGGFHRLHVLSGESLCSELGNLLKLGTTALVVLLADAGCSPAAELQFVDPLEAIHTYSIDPSCTWTAELETGEQVTAIEVQRRFLEAAELLVVSGHAPAWAHEICREWRAILVRLEDAPESIRTSLDWGIKLAIYRDRARRAELPWVPRGLRSIRDHLLELDTRFADIGPQGIFNMLDASGVLSHRRLEPCQIDDAVRNPPRSGRARKRGRYIRQLSGDNERYACNWGGIYDCLEERALRLGDPFGERAEHWQPFDEIERFR